MYSYVHSSTINNSWDLEVTWIYTYVAMYVCIYVYIYTYLWILLSHFKKMPFAAIWMNLEIMKLNGISQKKKDKNHMISLTGAI